MKIAFFDPISWDYLVETPRLKPLGGSQSSLCYLAEELARLGHEVTLINRTTTPGRSRGVESLRIEGVPVARYLDYDVVIVLNVASSNVPRAIRATGSNPPPIILWSQHNHDQPAVRELADRSIHESWDKYVLVSDWQAKGYKEGFRIDPGKIRILGNAISPAFENLFPQPQAIAAQKPWPPVLCYTSTPFRGLHVLLEAFPRIRAAIPGTRLRVFSSMSVYGVGAEQDPYAALYELCRTTEGVEYVGSLSQTALARELRGATCLAYPNTFAEGFCISVLEAMAAGCIVITSDLGALRDTTAGFGHLLAPHPDKEVHARLYADFAVGVLTNFRSSPQEQARLAAQVSAVNRTGTWAVRAKEWEAWLQSLIERKATPAGAATRSIDAAAAHYRAGRLQESEARCRQMLEREPGNAEALYLLGMVELQRARPQQAVDYIQQAVRTNPLAAAMHSDLGSAAKAAGNLQLALASYQRAIQLDPEFSEAHNNLGVVARQSGDLNAAESCYRRALQIKPDFAEAHNNLGNLCASQNRLTEAADAYRRAAELRPKYVSSLANLGAQLVGQGKLPQALEVLRDAVRIRPQSAETWLRLGDVLRSLGRLSEAADVLRQGVQTMPGNAELHFQLGNAWRDLGRGDLAIPCFQQTLRLQPDHFGAHISLAFVLIGIWNLDKAIVALEAAARLRPDAPEVYGNLGTVYLYRGQLRESVENYRRALSLNPEMVGAYSNLLLTLNYDCKIEPRALFEEHRRWGERYEVPIRASIPARRNAFTRPEPERRLRIGYVSPDFHDHPATRFFEPILENHDRQQLSVFCYALGAGRDATTDRLERLSEGWRANTGMTDEQIAEEIRGDAIDILVDLAGHTRNNRLLVFAHKPAPIQIAFLGYPNTTGLAAMDYVVTDEVLDPPGEPVLYTEEPIRLPHGFCPFRPLANAPAVAPLPATQSGVVTFGSVHNFAKLNSAVLDLWCQVLRAVPSSRLLIYRHTLTQSMQTHVRALFTARGISAERIGMHQASDVEQAFLGGYGQMDILLDTFPFSGHTTTCESLWMGVPVLTLYGNRRAGRMSASVLTQLGLTDWIARTPQDFVEIAVRASAEIARLAGLRWDLRRRMLASRLCDCAGYTRTLESAYRAVWRAWCAMVD